jgi:cyclophilin family peptidyl-prolyl cis-trans isomerase
MELDKLQTVFLFAIYFENATMNNIFTLICGVNIMHNLNRQFWKVGFFTFMSYVIVNGLSQAATYVQFNLNETVNGTNGPINYFQVQLLDDTAPITVSNFLKYVTNHDYDGTIIHRAVDNFVIQGGNYKPVFDSSDHVTALNSITNYGAIQNEFKSINSNIRGTIAMATIYGDPNSATNQWFINVTDNSSNLDYQNGGYAVFGQVIGEGMKLVDAVEALPTYNRNPDFDPYYDPNNPTYGPFSEVPEFNNGNTLITVTSISIVPEPSALVMLSMGAISLLYLWRQGLRTTS